MPRLNSSQASLSENLFDVSISGSTGSQSPRYGGPPPRRVGLMSNIPSTAEIRRPSDYFLPRTAEVDPKGSSKGAVRPVSNISLSSSETSKDSDDGALVVLTPFDITESRLSSATAASVYSGKITDGDGKHSGALDRDLKTVPIVSATANLSSRPLPNLPEVPIYQSSSPPRLSRHQSTSTTSDSRPDASGLMYTLTRTKTRYYNPKETKERKQLRKKLYEENDNDDVILSKDVSLVFNVPIIKKHHELYSQPHQSRTSYLSHDELMKVDDNKYHAIKQQIRPCPLPGVLSQNRGKSATEVHHVSADNTQDESSFSDFHSTSFNSVDTDEEVSKNISEFYALRSESYSKLVRASRDSHIYNLPNYVRSQSSIEDVTLISPEKLEMINQSRPINLPPKSSDDVSRHKREINRVLKSVETSNKSHSLSRQRMSENLASVQMTWNKVFATTQEKELAFVLNTEKERLRTIIWESHTHDSLTYTFFNRVLQLNLGAEAVKHLRSEYEKVELSHLSLSEQMKATKNAEFDVIISHVTTRPFINNFLLEAREHTLIEFDYSAFVKDFRHLLYLKSLSEGGLKKHHQIFVIPVFLILFRDEKLADVYFMIEMFDAEIFLEEVLAQMSQKLSCWRNLLSMSYSSAVYKVLRRFSSLEEFDSLNSTTIFELFLQFNDQLPLSLSAPSTPILSRGSFLSFSKIPEEPPNNNSLDSVPSSNSSECLMGSVLTYNAAISSLYKLLVTFLQLLVIYSRSRKRNQNYGKLMQSFLLTIFDYYHIGWNTLEELLKNNASIRLNHTNDQWTNLESFTTKWKQVFKKM